MVAQGADVLKPSVEMLLQWGGNAASEVQRGQNSLVLEAEMQKSTERMAAQMQRKP